MATPTFAQLKSLMGGGAGANAEDVLNRILTCLAVIASNQNPDGTTFFGNVAQAGVTNPINGFLSDYPNGAVPLAASSGNVANASAVATLAGTAGKTTYITGFEVTGLGATAANTVPITVATLVGGVTYVYNLQVPAGITTQITPLFVFFPKPIPANATNTAIVTTVSAFGAGNVAVCVNAHGYQL